ncbi:GNAT family N-acetyltransferase [Hymenobacter endophyticus]|uniref:GNAT family N-acetyltransferase n=1 Tax=Hymenobacter endophyticus TaxID=3076335 RepID=A0ABU3TC47_9BACT|nr:GNAT family N-acetyltransferase [Hymenobacter endophyticus]MDU0368943.1 GNAT family N-acetyltransferase [Hymenobacter endophyticus]
MLLRRATAADAPRIGQLFYDTITQVNCADYTAAQVAAWRGGWQNLPGWEAKIGSQHFLVAEDDATRPLSGFASLAADGYLDFLFVNTRHQRRGIAGQLLLALLDHATHLGLASLYTDASVTARPFFNHYGFTVEREQQMVVRGVELPNYRMVRSVPLSPASSSK